MMYSMLETENRHRIRDIGDSQWFYRFRVIAIKGAIGRVGGRVETQENHCAGSCEPGSRCRPNECIFGSGKPRGVGILE
jgi:hypothetical protein